MISNELLSAVLSRYGIGNITRVTADIKRKGAYYGVSDNIQYSYEAKDDSNGWKTMAEINIYELAHKCKEWAYSLGHVVSTQYRTDYSNATTSLAWCESLAYEGRQTFKADTEPEAIFKACEWILQQINQKESTSHQNNNS